MFRGSRRKLLALTVTVSALAVAHPHASPVAAAGRAPTRAAATAISFAKQQIGKPYLWGGTGPDAFDCSGLVMMAYQSAGVNLERTSEDQWASEPHVSHPKAGDFVFFAGADGTPGSPGHVGLVTNPRTHTMIDAYAVGFPVEYDTYGLPNSKQGLTDPAGFTDPTGGQ